MPADLGATLLALARGAIAREFGERDESVAFGLDDTAPAHRAALAEPAATFVTLTQRGELRGCMGSLDAHLPLRADVESNALAAAFRDPRFPALGRDEFFGIRIEVSLLSMPDALDCADEDDALARLRPGVDGLILSHRGRRATFLPQVWESLPRPRDFLAQLKLKAGLPADFWSDAVMLARYEVTKWKEALH